MPEYLIQKAERLEREMTTAALKEQWEAYDATLQRHREVTEENQRRMDAAMAFIDHCPQPAAKASLDHARHTFSSWAGLPETASVNQMCECWELAASTARQTLDAIGVTPPDMSAPIGPSASDKAQAVVSGEHLVQVLNGRNLHLAHAAQQACTEAGLLGPHEIAEDAELPSLVRHLGTQAAAAKALLDNNLEPAINHAMDVMSQHGDGFTSAGAMTILQGFLDKAYGPTPADAPAPTDTGMDLDDDTDSGPRMG
ncbi:MAG: hypothetical protein AWU57_345 [Marinobacter sp. T13-3]|nr:MAG: hypothetical protein AWU57_345 [Marinobacter sp. T13-3]